MTNGEPAPDRPRGSGAHVKMVTASERCAYCGAALIARFYFCPVCATPYKDEEDVLPPVRPALLTPEKLLMLKVPQAARLFWTYVAVLVGSALAGLLVFGAGRTDLVIVLELLALLVTTCIYAVVSLLRRRHSPATATFS